MNILKNINIGLAFLLEIFGIIILAYWGFSLNTSKLIQFLIGLSTPILMIIVWSILCAPSSAHRLEGAWLLLIKIIIFSVIITLLININFSISVIVFSLMVIINLIVSVYFGTL